MEEDSKLQQLTPADERLMDVYGDTIHLNDGTHLDGGVANDKIWQRRWREIVSCDISLREVPTSCALSKRFVNLLALEWQGARQRRGTRKDP